MLIFTFEDLEHHRRAAPPVPRKFTVHLLPHGFLRKFCHLHVPWRGQDLERTDKIPVY